MKQKNNHISMCPHIVNRFGQHLLFLLCKTSGFESLQFEIIKWLAKIFVLNFLAITNSKQRERNDFLPRDSHLAKIKIFFYSHY